MVEKHWQNKNRNENCSYRTQHSMVLDVQAKRNWMRNRLVDYYHRRWKKKNYDRFQWNQNRFDHKWKGILLLQHHGHAERATVKTNIDDAVTRYVQIDRSIWQYKHIICRQLRECSFGIYECATKATTNIKQNVHKLCVFQL